MEIYSVCGARWEKPISAESPMFAGDPRILDVAVKFTKFDADHEKADQFVGKLECRVVADFEEFKRERQPGPYYCSDLDEELKDGCKYSTVPHKNAEDEYCDFSIGGFFGRRINLDPPVEKWNVPHQWYREVGYSGMIEWGKKECKKVIPEKISKSGPIVPDSKTWVWENQPYCPRPTMCYCTYRSPGGDGPSQTDM